MATNTAGRVASPVTMRLLRPLRERDFALLFAGTLVSLLGDGIYLVALPFAVLELSDDPATLSLVGVAWSLGMVGFLLVGGLLSDRHDKRRILLIADVVRLVALAVAGTLALSGALEIWHLVGLGLMYGIGEGLTGPAMGAIVPELVPELHLVQANALERSLRPIAMRLLGPALGGVAVAVLGIGGALLVDAGTFAVSMACLLAMRSRPVEAPPAEPMRRQLLEAAVFVRTQTWLWATLVMAGLTLLVFLGPLEVLLPYRIKHELGGSAATFGLQLAAMGAGAVVGTFARGHVGMPARPVTTLFWLWGVATLGIAGYGIAGVIWLLMVIGFVFGTLSGFADPIWSTLMQTRVPPRMRGRVASMDWLVSIGLTPVSFALVGPVAALLGARATLVAAGVLGFAGAIAILYLVPGLREPRVSGREAAPSRP
jgi:DHA3 family tetracycline resistance protein-like MFS transporter